MALPYKIQKIAWNMLYAKSLDHTLILMENDPLLPAILGYMKNKVSRTDIPKTPWKGETFKTDLATT